MVIFQYTNKGNQDINQDYAGYRILNVDSAVCVVADGIGGYDYGEFASEAFVRGFLTYARWNFGHENPIDLLKHAFASGDDHVHHVHASKGGFLVGTVAVAALVIKDKAYIAWIGDSRATLIRNEKIVRQTIDHSYLQYMYNSGKIPTLVELECFNSLITKAIHGMGDTDKNIEILEWDLHSSDLLFLSSDGFHKDFSFFNLPQNSKEIESFMNNRTSQMNDNTTFLRIEI